MDYETQDEIFRQRRQDYELSEEIKKLRRRVSALEMKLEGHLHPEPNPDTSCSDCGFAQEQCVCGL